MSVLDFLPNFSILTIAIFAGVVNSQDVYPGEFPFLVSVQLHYDHICGGSILNQRWILTAAHCVVGPNAKEGITILAGTTNLNRGGVRLKVKQILLHELYFDSFQNDLALIQLARRLKVSRLIKPVVVSRDLILPKTYVVLSGWGHPKGHLEERQNFNKRSILKIISNESCKQYLITKIYEENVCTMITRRIGICQGDSGGPIIDAFSKKLVGVALGNIPDEQGYPDVYARIYNFLNWIDSAIIHE